MKRQQRVTSNVCIHSVIFGRRQAFQRQKICGGGPLHILQHAKAGRSAPMLFPNLVQGRASQLQPLGVQWALLLHMKQRLQAMRAACTLSMNSVCVGNNFCNEHSGLYCTAAHSAALHDHHVGCLHILNELIMGASIPIDAVNEARFPPATNTVMH